MISSDVLLPIPTYYIFFLPTLGQCYATGMIETLNVKFRLQQLLKVKVKIEGKGVKVLKVKSATASKHSNVPIPDQMAWLLGGHTSSTSHQFWYCNICQRSQKFASWAPELSVFVVVSLTSSRLGPHPPGVCYKVGATLLHLLRSGKGPEDFGKNFAEKTWLKLLVLLGPIPPICKTI